MEILNKIRNNSKIVVVSLIFNIATILIGRMIEGNSLFPDLDKTFLITIILYIFLDFLALEALLYHIENYRKKVPMLLGKFNYIKRDSKDKLTRNSILFLIILFISSLKFFIDFYIYRNLFSSFLPNFLLVLSLLLFIGFLGFKANKRKKRARDIPIISFSPQKPYWIYMLSFFLFTVFAYIISFILPYLGYTIIMSIIIGISAIILAIVGFYQFVMNPKKIANIFKLPLVLLITYSIYIFFSLPNVQQIEKVVNHSRVEVTIKNNKIINSSAINAIPIKYDSIRKIHLVKALITQEDRSFYSHLGFSIKGTAKGVKNLLSGRRGGGSTITQQLAKNLFLSGSRDKIRKVVEIFLALKIEINFTKEEILTMYFNNIFYGKNYYGIESASRKYFSKRTKNLNLYESALLIQTIPSPNNNNVKKDKERAFRRADRLLDSMQNEGYISEWEKARAKRTGIEEGDKILRPREYRFLYNYVKSDILKHCKNKNGVYTVVLTLEPEMQLYAQLALKRMVKKISGQPQSALLALSPDGAIRAMVGGNSYTDSSMNRTLQARRQPASTFKPIVYLSAIENGWKPTDKISANSIKIGNYKPRNAGNYSGNVTLQYALKHSINTTAVRLLNKIGYGRVDFLAERLGISEKLPHKPHLALGSKEISMMEMTKAYAVFSNGGKEVIPYGIELIRDKMRNIIYEHEEVKQKQIVKKEHIHDINVMLKSVFEKGGTAYKTGFIKEIAGKTGTGQGNKDAWFIGYSTYLTTAIWVGHDIPRTMRGVSGGKYPAVAWRNFMANSHDNNVLIEKLP